jgi:hypothetical protein
MHRRRYARIRGRHKPTSGLWPQSRRWLGKPPPKSAPSHSGTAVSRVAVVAILSFICGLVLSLGTIAEPIRRGSLDGSGYGGCSLLSATGSDSTGSGGPVLSIDVDITDDPGDEIATSHWTSPLEGYIELHGKAAAGARGGYKLLARVDSGPVVELEKIVLDWDLRSLPSGENGRTPSNGPNLRAESGQTGETAPMWATLILAQANYDQSAGAMSKTTVSTAYAWNGRTLVEVWSATTCSEAVWNLSWGSVEGVMANSWRWGLTRERALRDFAGLGGDVRATAAGGAKGLDLGPGNWVRLASFSSVEFVSGPVPSVVMKSLHEYHSYSEKDDAFKLMNSRQVAQTFCWSDRWNAFVLGEGTVGREGAIGMEFPGASDGTMIHPGTDLAILESERKCVEGLVFGPPFLLRVKLPDGSRCFVNEEAVLTSGLESVV